MTPKVEIFFCRDCPLCHKAIAFFAGRGVDFTARAVGWEAGRLRDSENARLLRNRCGGDVDFVPQIFVGKRHVEGWRGLEPLIRSGEIDRWLGTSDAADIAGEAPELAEGASCAISGPCG